MSLDDEKDEEGVRKIRFKTPARVLFASENKIEDLLRNDKDQNDVDYPKKGKHRNLSMTCRS